jgi:alanine-glyoxylate transaminase/serine-glyoxylate transaminase/serine-pyruvate transaminase
MRHYNQLNIPERILMGPGPTNVHPRVLQAMASPTIGHLDPKFLEIMDDVQELLRWLFRTKNNFTITVSGTGSAGMETCFANVFERGEKVLIGVNGVFGKRMVETARKYGLKVISFEKDWGSIIDHAGIEAALERENEIAGVAIVHGETSTGVCQPLEEIGEICKKHDVLFLVDTVSSLGGVAIEVDKWNIDACYSGTQKCMSCPPGLAPVTFSEKALNKIENRNSEVESWYLDMTLVRNYWSAKRAYHHTAPINMVYALRESLVMLYEEGFDKLLSRHLVNSRALLAGLDKLGLKPLVEESNRLPQLNSVKVPENIDEKQIRSILLNEYNIEIGAGLGPLAGKIWRIGLMGQSSTERNVVFFLATLEQILKNKGVVSELGRASKAAEEVYSNI